MIKNKWKWSYGGKRYLPASVEVADEPWIDLADEQFVSGDGNAPVLRRCKGGKYMLYIPADEVFTAPFALMSYMKGEDNDFTEEMLPHREDETPPATTSYKDKNIAFHKGALK